MKIFILLIIITFIVFKVFHINIKWKTFFRKGFAPSRGAFGVYCFCGKQGRGKTYSIVEFLKDNKFKNFDIYSNIRSINGIKYTYFDGFDNLLKLRSKRNCIIVYDEIFTALTRSSKLNTDVLDFLSQMRKRQIIFLTSAQEWLEINITLRRYCRYQIECNMRNILGLGILTKKFYDAEHMKWDSLSNDYVAPLLSTTISKCNVKIANSYDTNEQISSPISHGGRSENL